jgi:hypothetical protein
VSRALSRLALPAALIALALGASGCFGDDEDEGITIPTAPATTGETPTFTTTPTEATTPTAPEPPDPSQGDTPENDVPPASGSPESQFEQFCEQHPEACS